MTERPAKGPQIQARRRDTTVENRHGRIVTFYSYKGGTGRTMALANTAWILAANGYRVLVVDWDLEAPGLAQFFRPFLNPEVVAATTGIMDLFADYLEEARRPIDRDPEWIEDFARIHPHALSLAWPHFPGSGRIDLVPAGQQNRDYSVARLDWDLLYERYEGRRFIQSLRADMKRRYDYVLIDSRTGLTDTADICTVEMPDDLVVCFTLSDQSIDGSSRIARVIEDRYGDRDIRIMPVPMRIDEGEKEKADAGRALARIKFAGLPAGFAESDLARYWAGVEIPYRPFYAYEEILAPFGDQPGLPGSMLAANERLTREITQGRVAGLPPMPEDLRLRHLDGFARRRPTAPADLYLSYVPEDRAWADWVSALLADAGYRVVPRDVGAGANPREATGRGIDSAYRTVALLSAAYLQSPQAQALWDRTVLADPAGARRQLIPVRVSDVRLNAPYNSRNPVDLIGRDEQAAATTLLRALGRNETELPERTPGAPRFPGTKPTYWEVPQRNHSFTGRVKVLDDLRAQLAGGTTAVLPPPQTLYGLGGVGKTQVALEYAHRYMSHYDLVWWIDAEQSENVVVDLAELASRLGLRVGDNVNEAAQAARDALRQGNPTPNWLLIFDNADEPSEIRRFFPDGPGHILVTSRNQGWSGQAGVLNVDVFDRTESVDHLTRRVRGLARADADRVADAVGDLPLAVEVAAAWLETTRTPVDTYVSQLKAEATRVLAAGETPVDYPTPVGLTWNVSITRLREQSPAAVRLLELCAFFAPEPISLKQFFFSEQMRVALYPYDEELTDTFLLGKVLRAVSRYALAKTDAGSDSFQVHRLVQAVVRSGMTDADRNIAAHQVHRILVNARPPRGDTDDPANWPTLEKIWPHLAPSRAQDCDEREVRELLIDRVRYLWKRVDLSQALQLGRQLDEAWTVRSESEADPVEKRTWQRQILSLRLQTANVLRSQGAYNDALELDQATLAGQRELLGEHHPYTLMTANSMAADLRYLSRFQEALALDLDTYSQFVELFGEDDPRTLTVANNLAIDHRLVGNSREALELDQDTFERNSAVRGSHHPYTLGTKSNVARDLRELGDYKGSVDLLREVTEAFADLTQSDLPEELRNAKSLAVSLRRAGKYAEARELTERTYERYIDLFGPDFADALACRLNLAADLSAAGDKETARDIATDAYEGHRRLFGDEHPFTYACENNLSIYLRGSSDVAGAISHGRSATEGLGRVLGHEHPFTLNASINLANALAENRELAEAEAMARAAYGGLVTRYGANHPDALICQANLAVTLRVAGRRSEAENLRMQAIAALVELFGEDHPSVLAARSWQRSNRDLEPQPL
ncbi:FxSxx-COOH system tetratricopeptide repeat protein [Kitasatospora sp. CB01950]|uniref:FxSxx-COOH system tetratricopeptide repeat protein n=1 Tax=Kitasatospora sp. CB01950 TaxID=1703930 RepID=UPI000A91D45E|nr:FxSxx-COOH system tetratricopeptide repeat protein [Kitasatospora sp. CB01950]